MERPGGQRRRLSFAENASADGQTEAKGGAGQTPQRCLKRLRKLSIVLGSKMKRIINSGNGSDQNGMSSSVESFGVSNITGEKSLTYAVD